jgi:MFS family permease
VYLTNHICLSSAAMHMAVAVCICPVGGIISTMIGRRKCFMACTSVGTLGWIILALSPNIPALFIGRFLTNLSASGLSATVGKFYIKFLSYKPSYFLLKVINYRTVILFSQNCRNGLQSYNYRVLKIRYRMSMIGY